MSQLLRYLSMVVILLLAILSPALLQPEWAGDLGLETLRAALRPYPGPCEQAVAAEGDRRRQACDRRIEKKTQLIQQLVAGQVTLFEAAAHFRRWNDEYPQLPPDPQDRGDTYDERVCSQVIQWARSWLTQHYPDAADQCVGRLQDELCRHKAEHGRVLLPKVVESEDAPPRPAPVTSHVMAGAS